MSSLGSDEKIAPAQTESRPRGELEPELTTTDRNERHPGDCLFPVA